MERENNRSYHRRPRPTRVRSGLGTGLLITVCVVAAVVFSIAIFFEVDHIVVRGNAVYDTQSVVEASGLEKGDNLLSVNRASVAAKVEVTLPYVEHVRVERALPGTVILEITESDVVFSVPAENGTSWLMNSKGKLLEQAPADPETPYPTITGFTLKAPAVGEKAKSVSSENLQAVLDVLSGLEGTGLLNKVTKVDGTKSYDLIFWYEDRFEICFGTTAELEHKARYLQAVIGELTDYQSGTIDMTFEDKHEAIFMPW